MELGEEEVLDLLERRYNNHLFSFTLDRVLFAINPYRETAADAASATVPQRSYDTYLQLTDQERADDLWSVPDRAITGLSNSNQSIFFFGESGSG